VAAAVKQATGLVAELVVGNAGEFTVWLGDELVAEKRAGAFPAPEAVVAAIQAKTANAG
jgi:hypothetical protein